MSYVELLIPKYRQATIGIRSYVKVVITRHAMLIQHRIAQ